MVGGEADDIFEEFMLEFSHELEIVFPGAWGDEVFDFHLAALAVS